MSISSPKFVLTSKLTIFSGFKVPPSCATGGGCLRRFGTLRKNTSWNFGACILWILLIFVDFRIPQHCAAGGNCLRRFGRFRKNTPWNFGACIFWIVSILVDFRVPKVVPAQNDADGDGDEPTTAMPHSHQQANTHRDQISRSGENPSL